MTERALVTIDGIAAGGDGVGRVNGLVVFIPRTAPGDTGLVEFNVKGRLARGRMLELQHASAARVPPPCPYYVRDHCGGCQLQHLGYEAQLHAKSRLIADAFGRIGRRDIEPPPVQPAVDPWRYRRKLTLALRRHGDRWIAGLHPYDAPGRVFALDDCPITDSAAVARWREVMEQSALLPRAAALRGAVRLMGDRFAFTLEGGERWPTARRFFDALPCIAALWWQPDRQRRRLLHDRRSDAEPGASFVQVNPAMAAELSHYLVERALSHGPATAVDAYAGAGDSAVALAARGVTVRAIELDAEAAAWAASRLAAPSGVTVGRVEDALEAMLPADVVVLNPPRAGVHERVTALLAARPPRALLYVSCNPATLARDLARLPGYRVATVRAFDMFPQTAHVETVCELIPEAA